MKILVIDAFGKSRTRKTNSIPRIGDMIDFGYAPAPKVDAVIWWPNEKKLEDDGIEVLIYVS